VPILAAISHLVLFGGLNADDSAALEAKQAQLLAEIEREKAAVKVVKTKGGGSVPWSCIQLILLLAFTLTGRTSILTGRRRRR